MELRTNCFAVVLVVAIVLAVYGTVSGFVWPYTINTWLVRAGKDAAVSFWGGVGIGFIPLIGQLGIPAAFCTWVAILFLV